MSYKNKVIVELAELTTESLKLIIPYEELDSDFSILRELAEQLLDEIESFE